MMRTLHNHIFASKLHGLLTQSPLVLVYQPLGDVAASAVSSSLQASISAAKIPDSQLQARVCRMRNSVAASTGNTTMEMLFQASTVVAGFCPPQSASSSAEAEPATASSSSRSSSDAPLTTHQQQHLLAPLKVKQDSSLTGLLSGLFQQQQGGGQPSSGAASASAAAVSPAVMKALIDAGLKLPSEHPVVLLGAFYQRQHIRLNHLAQWSKLDYGQVQGGIR